MKTPRKIVAAAAVLALCAGPAAAVVELQKLDWQQSAPAAKAGASTAASAHAPAKKTLILESLKLSQGDRLPPRLGGLVKLLNRGPAAEEGILLRYVVTARVLTAEDAQGTWSLPFLLDTRRVPKIGPNQVVEVAIDASTMLDLYLKKLVREGWWLDDLKLEVLLEPRAGEPKKLQILRAELPVEKSKP